MTPNPPPRPDLVPTSSPPPGRPHPSDLVPRPHPYGGRGRTETSNITTTTTPPPRPRDEVSDHVKKHQTEHLLLAARVAGITGDPEGTLAVLLGCPNCNPSGPR